MSALNKEEERILYEKISFEIDNHNFVTRSLISEAARNMFEKHF